MCCSFSLSLSFLFLRLSFCHPLLSGVLSDDPVVGHFLSGFFSLSLLVFASHLATFLVFSLSASDKSLTKMMPKSHSTSPGVTGSSLGPGPLLRLPCQLGDIERKGEMRTTTAHGPSFGRTTKGIVKNRGLPRAGHG